MASIRDEAAQDAAAIRALLEAAFPQSIEAGLVEKLRRSCPECLSLVAVEDGRLVGHILFSPVTIESGRGPLEGFGLGPMAVLPGRQNRGIGSALVRAGLERLRAADCPFVVVVGHPAYYLRFGFEPGSRHGLRCQWDEVPAEAFLVLVLQPVVRPRLAGLARYRPEFDAAV